MALYPFGDFVRSLRGNKIGLAVKSEVDQGELLRVYERATVGAGNEYSPSNLTFNSCEIDHLVFSTKGRVSLELVIEAQNEENEWEEVYFPYDIIDGKMRNSPENIVEGTNYTGIWDVLEYNTDNSIYVLKNKHPLHFPNGVRFKLVNHGTTGFPTALQIIGREFEWFI